MDYQPSAIEKKWRQFWKENKVYKTNNESDKPKYYVLDMFPYPSGAGLHVGHPLGYIASDIFARYKRLQGFNVLHPMGYDAFGLPAEQYAIQTGVHPAVSTAENMARYRDQLDNLGFCFDWDRQVNTSDPNYYKWTQSIFLKLFGHYYDNKTQKATAISDLVAIFEQEGNANVEAATSQEELFTADYWKSLTAREQEDILMNYRLAYRKTSYVNWCEELGTVLANDEVKDGVSERGGYPVTKKPMLQWALRITAYAERLLTGLDNVEFSEALKTQQQNWIGRSQGAKVFFEIDQHDEKIEVFTTRPDTIYGATFMVLAPEHELVQHLTTPTQQAAIDEYMAYTNSRSERDRMADVKTVTGAFTGAYAINPMSGTKVPIWIADYVLAGYGTGAIMAVPCGDERDARFAEKFGLDIIQVIDQSAHEGAEIRDKVGTIINSGELNGLEIQPAIEKAIALLEQKGIGEGKINYRLRDANFSRQRYWGEPFPIEYDEHNVPHIIEDLPVRLPKLDNFKPTKEGQAPLARATEWMHEHEGMIHDIDTMPGFAGSSWYFLRYMDPENGEEMFSKKAVDYWQQVDLYVGGAEHAVGHLMYSRFWHKFLYDLGFVPTTEPYKKLVNQGMLQGMIEFVYILKEKRIGKPVFVSADKIQDYEGKEMTQIPILIDFVTDYGGDASYLDAVGIERFKNWRNEYNDAIFVTNDKGQLVTHSEVGKISKSKYNVINPDDVVAEYGADCFRLYEMFLGPIQDSKPWDVKGITGVSKFLRKLWSLFYKEEQYLMTQEKATKEELKVLHTLIKKVNYDIEHFSFNTCVAAFMIAVNDLRKLDCHKEEILTPLVLLLAPFAPFIAEELWHIFGNKGSIHAYGQYPQHDEHYLIESTIEYPICINGKKKTSATFEATASKGELEQQTLALEEVQALIEGKTVRKVIVVPKRMVNIVVG